MKKFLRVLIFVMVLVPLATIFSACGKSETNDDPPPKTEVETKITAKCVKLEYSEVEYDGTEKKPEVTVVVAEKTLDSEEYTVTYSDNMEVGTAKVSVSAVEGGKYEGSAEVTFEITKMKITLADVYLQYDSIMYSGEENTPTVIIERNYTVIPSDNYTVSYKNNVNAGTAVVVIKSIEGDTNYSIDIEKTFTIAALIYDPETWEVVVEYSSVVYDGTEKRPTVTVTVGGVQLVEGRDYQLTYLRNIDIGTAAVAVESIEGSNYNMSLLYEFEITDPGAPPPEENITEPEEAENVSFAEYFEEAQVLDLKK